MKETALTQLHIKAGARMVEYAGYLMPVEFSGVNKENLATRKAAGLFDISHMGEIWVKGPGALEMLQYVTTNDVARLQPGKAQYSCLPNGRGGIVDDLIVYQYGPEKYMLVVNAANIDKDWEWLNSQKNTGTRLENASGAMSMIALQGPKAKDILSGLTNAGLNAIPSFGFTIENVAGIEDVIISATGYTGAGGYELFCYNQGASQIWEALLETGRVSGLEPAGLASRDTLRLEMGYSLYGNEIDDSTSPLEAGLGWIVKLDKDSDFIDKPRYIKQRKEGLKQKLIAFEMMERGIPRHGYQVADQEGNIIGRVTSGTQSPGLGKGIGLAYILTEQASLDNNICIQIRNKSPKARIVKLPFIK